MKLDASGNLSWQRSLGGSGDEVAYSIQQTDDGGYIVAGWSFSNDGDVSGNNGGSDYWIVKLDASGTISWQRSLGGSGDEEANSIQQTTDGGYIVAGKGGFGLLRLNGAGDTIWTKTMNIPGSDYIQSVEETDDGGFIVSGYTDGMGAGGKDVFLIKLDASGIISWFKLYGNSLDEFSYTAMQCYDGGYVITGNSNSNSAGSSDIFLIKTDGNGTVEWANNYGTAGYEWGNDIVQTQDNGFVITGTSLLLKTDSIGTLIWSRTYGGSSVDWSNSLEISSKTRWHVSMPPCYTMRHSPQRKL